jgi:hypothetical protein
LYDILEAFNYVWMRVRAQAWHSSTPVFCKALRAPGKAHNHFHGVHVLVDSSLGVGWLPSGNMDDNDALEAFTEAATAGDAAKVVEALRLETEPPRKPGDRSSYCYSARHPVLVERLHIGEAEEPVLKWAVACDRVPLSVLRVMVEMGVPIGARDKEGNTAVHTAVQLGRGDVLELLSTRDKFLEACLNSRGRDVLTMAASAGNATIVRQLLDRVPGLVKHVTVPFKTALTCACAEGHVEVARMLLQAGANPIFCARSSLWRAPQTKACRAMVQVCGQKGKMLYASSRRIADRICVSVGELCWWLTKTVIF